jgi:hypothetical protein
MGSHEATALFVSYAHNDNEPLVAGQTGWVEHFQYALKVRLKQVLGRDTDIWWDLTTLRGNDVLDSAIEKGIGRATVLVAVVSPSYVNFERSEWCRRELESFIAATVRADAAGDPRNHIFKVLKTVVPRDEEPELLRPLRGYEFYRTEPTTGRIREFFLHAPSAVEQEYLTRIDDLAQGIRAFLDSQKHEAMSSPSPGAPGAAAKAAEAQVIYLAETTFDLAADRDQIARMLRQRGYVVLPERNLSVVHGATLRKEVQEHLRGARLSIHPIGVNYGVIPEGEAESVTEIQNALAAERSADPRFFRLIWMPADLQPSDDRQRKFLERLRNDSEAQRGAEILHTSLAELGTLIQTRLRPRPDREPTASRMTLGPDGSLKQIYLMCDRRDRDAAEALRDELYARYAGLEVSLPPLDGDETDIREIHRDYLKSCDGVLLYYGDVPESWLLTKLNDVKKVRGWGRERPFLAKGIYVAAPATAAKDRYRTREALVLRDAGGTAIQALAPFLKPLGFEVPS